MGTNSKKTYTCKGEESTSAARSDKTGVMSYMNYGEVFTLNRLILSSPPYWTGYINIDRA